MKPDGDTVLGETAIVKCMSELQELGRVVDHKPQRSHLKGLSHNIPFMAALDSVAQTNMDQLN